MTVSLVSARWIVTGVADRHTPVIHSDAALAHENGRVIAVGPAAQMRADYPGATETRYPQHMMLPGFVNSHHHVGMTPLQLGSPDYALELWFASRLSARDIDPYLDTLYSAFEMIGSGITTVQHIQGWLPGTLPEAEKRAGQTIKAYEDVGMRVSYCYADGALRYSYDVKPDTASFVAACELAGEAMERAIQGVAMAHPSPRERPYTKRQLEILEHFRAEMVDAGGLLPTWWEYSSAREIAQAGIDAVRNWNDK